MTRNNGMVQACTLGFNDTIQVPVEDCKIVATRRVPGQLKNRKNYLIEVTFVPLSGPWQNIEGKAIYESNDLVPLIERESPGKRRRRAIAQFFSNLREAILGPKVEPMRELPPPPPVRRSSVIERPMT